MSGAPGYASTVGRVAARRPVENTSGKLLTCELRGRLDRAAMPS